MADLIDRQDLITHLNECIVSHGIAHSPLIDAVLTAIKCAVEQMPTVEPKRGECDTCGWHNACNWETLMHDWDVEHGYCAAYNCGARMRGEEDD